MTDTLMHTAIEVPFPYEVLSAFISDDLNSYDAIAYEDRVPDQPVYWLVRFRNRNDNTLQHIVAHAITLQDALTRATHTLYVVSRAGTLSDATDEFDD